MIIGAYAPNMDQQQFWEEIRSLLDEHDHSILLLGDFNTVMDTRLDCSGKVKVVGGSTMSPSFYMSA